MSIISLSRQEKNTILEHFIQIPIIYFSFILLEDWTDKHYTDLFYLSFSPVPFTNVKGFSLFWLQRLTAVPAFHFSQEPA